MRILIVDDERDILNVLAVFLQKRGHDVLTATNGADALTAIQNDSEISVVLLDVVMPQRGGMEILKEITQHPSHPHVIMMTARADEKIFEAVRLGAVDYVFKPFDFGTLETTVSAAARHPKNS